MGGAASKIKGSSAERELAKLFTTVFNGSFIRSAASGGYVGGKNSTRKAHLSDQQIRNAKGDLVPPDFMPRFVVEVKSYDAFRFHQLLAANARYYGATATDLSIQHAETRLSGRTVISRATQPPTH